MATHDSDKNRQVSDANLQERRGCAFFIQWLLCWLYTILCALLGRFFPQLCKLREQACRFVVPPTTALAAPVDCTEGAFSEFPPASGMAAYLVSIRGKAFGGGFTGYKLGYRTGSSGAFIENDAKIIYPNNQTNATLGAGFFTTPIGNPTVNGLLGRLNASLLTEGHYEIQLRVAVGGTTRVQGFDLEREYVEIGTVNGMVAPNPMDETSQLPEVAGGAITITGSADSGGCADKRVDTFTLEVAEGFLSEAAIIALPAAARTPLILPVDYTTDPVFATMPRPRLGELTIRIFHDTCTIGPFTFDCGKTAATPWDSSVGGAGTTNRFNIPGRNGRHTLLLTVRFSDGTTAHESQQVWLDNRIPVAWIGKILQVKGGVETDVSGCKPISKANGTLLRLKGVALDPLILPTPTQPAEAATAPNNNFGGYSVAYSEDGLSTFLAITASGPGPIGTVGIDTTTGQTLLDMTSPVEAPSITTDGLLAEWDISALDPCAYVVRVSVNDTTVVSSSGNHTNEFFYALTITA